MRILQVNKHYAPTIGGIETVAKNLAEGLQQIPGVEMEVLVCHNKPRITEMVDGVIVHRSHSWVTLLSMPLSLDFFLLFRKLSPHADLIILHHPFPLGFLAYLLFARKKPMVVYYHSDIVRQKLTGRLALPLIYTTLRQAKKIFASGNRVIKNSPVLQRYENKCIAMPYGLSLERFVLTDSVQAEVLKIKAKINTPLVLSIGRLVYYKGFEYLIEAMASVPATLHIMGAGPLQAKLEQKIVELDLGDRVKIIAPVEDLVPHYFAADIFVLASVAPSEAFGLVQVEAMAASTPVINTDLPTTVPELSVHGLTGFTVKPLDVVGLAAAIQQLLSNEALRRQFSDSARARAVQEYSLPSFITRFWQEIEFLQ
jgi:glycosyltransferase involved in cell wall biosynthesis